jgi:hypothetical protein
MRVMALADPYCVLAELARAGRALEPSDLALRLDWRTDRVCAALHALTAIRPMPVGVDAYGQFFITPPGRRRLRPHGERDVDDDDDDDDEPDDAA